MPKPLQLQGFEADCEPLKTHEKAEREGFEPSVPVKVHRFSRPERESDKSYTKNDLSQLENLSCTLSCTNSAKTDPALARLIDAWPSLPEHAKATILGIVDVVR